MDRSRIADILNSGQPGETVTVAGWVRTRRDSKAGVSFAMVNDGSCLDNLQLVVDSTDARFADLIKEVTTGSSVIASGALVESQGGQQRIEVQVDALELVGPCDSSYPIQKKRATFEFLREIAHLRPRTNTFGCVARVRNAICFAIHEFFQQRDFLYVHTPVITTSDCEGAGEMFQVTTLDLARLAQLQTELDWSQDFFGSRASLTVSGQLEAEIYATALGDVYTFGPTFRAENSNTPRHLAEFWMIEPEMAFCDLEQNMDVAESFIKEVITTTRERCGDDLDFFNLRIDDTLHETLETIVDKEFIRLPYTEAIGILEQSGREFEYPVDWGRDLQSEHERFLTEDHFKQPVILFDYPRTIKPFYMRCNDDGKTVRAMDVLVPRVGEIIGGSQREERPDVLTERMTECGLDAEEYWWYLELRKFGTVPHAGFGLGLERMVQLVTGMKNIRDVIPFPRTPRNAAF